MTKRIDDERGRGRIAGARSVQQLQLARPSGLARKPPPLIEHERAANRGMDSRSTVLTGLVLAIVFFGGFGTWAALAPLKGAVIASGTLKVRGDRKEVEHLEGGILSEALVTDGQKVAAGDVLFRLDATRFAAGRKRLVARMIASEARRARLIAEKANASSFRIEVPADRELAPLALAEQVLFETRKARHDGQIRLLDERIKLVRQEIAAHQALIVSARNQLAYLKEEIGDATFLMRKGLQRKPRFLALKRSFESIDGSIRQREALIARSRQEIVRSEQERMQLDRQREDEIARESRETTDAIVDARQQLAMLDEQIARLQVRAPVSGTIVGVGTKTAGAVVSPGERLLEIVPGDGTLIVEARIALNDIEAVRPGAHARVRLSAYNARRTAPLDATLELVSADRMHDERTGDAFFRAELTLDKEMLKERRLSIVPGMAADVLIETRDMTLLDYLLGPLTEAVDKAMRER